MNDKLTRILYGLVLAWNQSQTMWGLGDYYIILSFCLSVHGPNKLWSFCQFDRLSGEL